MLKLIQIEILFTTVAALMSACASTNTQSHSPVIITQGDIKSPLITNSDVLLQQATDIAPSDVQGDESKLRVIELTEAVEDLQGDQVIAIPTLPQYIFYGDLPDPAGGWISYIDETYGFSFEYPEAYDTGECGRPYIETDTDSYQLLFDQSTINIQITDPWTGDLLDYVLQLAAEDQISSSIDTSEIQELNIDGSQAFLYYRFYSKPSATSYEKLAFTSFDNRLYRFRVAEISFNTSCGVRPISEEGILDHILLTWEHP